MDNNQYRRESHFLERVDHVIYRFMENESFDTSALCRELNLSKMQLYRKIKQASGRSIALYIRLKRLEKAHELLQRTDWSISEIAYQVGFKDPNYFSRVFNEEFGIVPRSLRR